MRIESNILIFENPFFFLIFRNEKLDYTIVFFFNKLLTFSLFINDGDRARITRRLFSQGTLKNPCELKNECFVAAILNFKQAVNWKRGIFVNGSTF